MNKPDYNIVSFSGGKDSTAMLIHMLELGMQVDEIIFCDTGLEFPQMYEHIDKVEQYIGRKITRIKPEKPFEWHFFEWNNRTERCKFQGMPGHSWATIKFRWCTAYLKNYPRQAYLKPLKKDYHLIYNVGLAADEQYRLTRKGNQNKDHRHPLVEWGWTEAMCLEYCKKLGFDWGGLYDLFARVSCWCCPLQRLSELRNLRRYFPDLWQKLREWDRKTWRQFRRDYSVEDLEKKFATEDQQQGLF